MEFVCERRKNLQRSELLLHRDGGEDSAYYEKMLTYNRIPGILRYGTTKEEGRQYCRYDIGAKQSLMERYEPRKLAYGQLKWLVEEILRVIEEGREYLIDEKDIVLRPDCIFLGNDCEELYLCCYPAYQREVGTQFAELFEVLMERLDYKDPSAVLLLYKLYIRCREGGCSAAEMRALLEAEPEKTEETHRSRLLVCDSIERGAPAVCGARPEHPERLGRGIRRQNGKDSVYRTETR